MTSSLPSQEAPVAWLGYWPGAGSVDSVTHTTHSERIATQWKAGGVDVTPLVPAESLASMRRERDEALPWALFYRDGLNLKQIAEQLGGSVYDYSPALTTPLRRVILETSEAYADNARAAAETLASMRRALDEALEGKRVFAERADRYEGYASRVVEAETKLASAAAEAVRLREGLTEIASAYDGEDGRLPVPLVRIGHELRRRQNIARALLNTPATPDTGETSP